MRSDEKLREVILEILRKTKSLTRTQLVKLCFLVDHLAVERLGRQITGVSYEMYFYGPYSPVIINTARKMELERLLIKNVGISFATGEPYYIYRLSDVGLKERGTESVLEAEERDIINEVVQKHDRDSLRQLLDFVYNLPEVKKAKLGERIVLGGGLSCATQ